MKTPRQLIKLFFGTLLFTFLTVVLSAYIFANTFLKHYLLSELSRVFPAELKVGYLASDLFSYISIKNVSFKSEPGKTRKSPADNTAEVTFESLSLNGSIFDIISKKSDLILNFKGLDIKLKSDGRKLYFPDNLGINEIDITSAGGSALLNFFKIIVLKDCNITVEIYNAGFGELIKTLSLNKLSANMRLTDREKLKFIINSGFEFNDEIIKVENIFYDGALNIKDMVLSGKLSVNEGGAPNSIIFKNSPVDFDAKFSGNYDFTLFLSKLDRKVSDYLSGRADFKISSGSLTARAPFYSPLTLSAINGGLEFDPAASKLSLKDFSARAFNSHIDIIGGVNLASQEVNLSFKSKEFIAPFGVKNFETIEIALSPEISVTANYKTGLGTMVSTAPRLNIVNFKRKILAVLNDATAEVAIDAAKNIFKLERFGCSLKSGNMSAALNYDISSEFMDGTCEARGIEIADIQDLLRHFGVIIDGRINLKKINAGYRLDLKNLKNSSVKGACDIAGYSLLSKDFSVKEFDYEYKNGTVYFNKITFDSPHAGRTNAASGSYDTAGGSFSFASKDFLADLSGAGKNWSGLYAVNINCEGSHKKYNLDFKANIKQIKYNSKPVSFSNLSGRIIKSGDGYVLENITLDDDIKVKKGSIDKNYNFNLEASLYEVSVSRIKNFSANEKLSALSGYITAKINASGNLYDLDKITTSAEINKLALTYDKIKIGNNSVIKIKNQKTKLEFESFNASVNGHSVKIDGFADYAGSGEVAVKLKLEDTDLKMMKLYAGDYIEDISGRFGVEGKLNGSLSDFKFNGSASADAKNIKIKGLDMPIEEFSVSLESKNYDITVKKGSMKFAGTDWEIGGKAIINYKESPLFLDLAFECKKLKLDLKEKGIIEGASKLGLKGEITKPRLYGSCRISKAKIELDSAMFKTKKEPVKVGPVELDIIIFADKNVWLSNNFINAELKGKFNIKTVKENLAYTGDIAAVRGVVNFNGHEFKIDNGKLQFNDNPAFDPLFNIDAHTNIDIFKIMLRISGSTSKPLFTLSSQPALTQPEITALLTTGRAQNDMNSKEAASMPAKMYADYQKEKALGGIKKSLQKGLDLDELSVKTSGTDEKGRRIDNSVTVGKYVNDKLFVNYTETKEQDNANKVKSYKFNYKLNKNTDLDIKESNADGSSVGVKVKRDF